MLKSCVECGGAVSERATTCPHCGKEPHGIECRACGTTVREADAHRYRHRSVAPSWYCQACADRLRSTFVQTPHPDATCPECRADLVTLWTFDELFPGFQDRVGVPERSCPHCGYKPLVAEEVMKAGRCNTCGLPLYQVLQPHCQKSQSAASFGLHHHPSCLPTDVQDPAYGTRYRVFQRYGQLESEAGKLAESRPRRASGWISILLVIIVLITLVAGYWFVA